MCAENKISKVLLFSCGYCANDLKHIFKGYRGKENYRIFPANVCCIVHKQKGVILYDTGYSDLIYKNGLISIIYNRLNPATVSSCDYITSKLKNYNIPVSAVKEIILSHAHPDHMGGLSFFKGKPVVMSAEVLETISKPKLRNLVFKNMKKSLNCPVRVVTKKIHHPLLSRYFPEVFDLLGDGSLLGVKLNGHAKGQLGLYIQEANLFLAADSAWGTDFLPSAKKMRLIPKLIQQNYNEYIATSKRLEMFLKESPEIKVVFSHSPIKEGEYER